MANFFKDSMAELEHVVWPTHLETKKFFQIVVSILAGMTVFTYLLTLAFSNGMIETRKLIHAPKAADISGSPTLNTDAIKVDAKTADGQSITVTPKPVESAPVPAPVPAQ
jgi:preprotein translocase SecE subunit